MVQSTYICSLATADVGQDLEIRSVETGSGKNDRRLRDFGLLEGRHVRLLAKGDPLDQASPIAAIVAAEPDEVYNLAARSFAPTSWSQPVPTGEFTEQRLSAA